MTDNARPISFASVLRVREFRGLWFAHLLLLLGESMKMLALSALVYERTKSPLLAAVAYLSGFLPQAFGSSILLAFADMIKPRTLLVVWDIVRAVGAALLASGLLSVPEMLVLVLVLGTFDPVPAAAKLALLPEILGDESFVVGRSLINITVGVTQIAGFAVGGTLLALLGSTAVLWASAGLAVISATVLRCRLSPRLTRLSGGQAKARTITGITATWRGNRVLLADRRVRGLLLAQWIPASWIVGIEALLVSYSAQIGRPRSLGVFLVAAAAGMLVGDLVVGRFIAQRQRDFLALPLAVLLGMPYLGFLLRPDLYVAAGLAVIASIGFGYNLCLQSPFFDAVPEQMRGQALGMAGSGLMSCQGVAAAIAGGVAEAFTASQAIALASAASLLSSLFLIRTLRPSALQAAEHPPEQPGQVDQPEEPDHLAGAQPDA